MIFLVQNSCRCVHDMCSYGVTHSENMIHQNNTIVDIHDSECPFNLSWRVAELLRVTVSHVIYAIKKADKSLLTLKLWRHFVSKFN